MLKVGLTGGIASGKSTVAENFAALGIPVIYADHISREVVEPNSEGLSAVQQAFGDSVLSQDGTLNRAALRERVFSDPKQRQLLESILHPLIRDRSDALEAQARENHAPYVVFEIPLLLETGRYKDMDRVIVVDVSQETQLARVMARDHCSRAQAESILAVQSSRSERLEIADEVILNEAKKESLQTAVAELHQKLMDLSASDEH